jgi:hypothetical protein
VSREDARAKLEAWCIDSITTDRTVFSATWHRRSMLLNVRPAEYQKRQNSSFRQSYELERPHPKSKSGHLPVYIIELGKKHEAHDAIYEKNTCSLSEPENSIEDSLLPSTGGSSCI